MSVKKLFTSYKLGNTSLKNRVVMAPMTRSRAINNVPNALMASYYARRANAGLIITEGVSPSPNGLGYARIPGAFSKEQTEGWKLITKAVHDLGGHIFMQLMHTGRVTHPLNLPAGAQVLAPSAIAAAGEMWTDAEGMKPLPQPKAFNSEELQNAKQEYIQAAKNAIEAGLDGIELHGANGYLLEQFISPFSNKREDEYGGSIENRIRFVVETAAAVAKEIGKEKVGIRLSPYGAFNDMPAYNEIHETYTLLTKELNKIGIAYIHVVDHSSMGAPVVPVEIKQMFRKEFSNTLILSGGYNEQRAEEDLEKNNADLIAFGKPFINNPDLVDRFINKQPLSENLDQATFYTPGEKGYTDYPAFVAKLEKVF